MKYKVYFPVGYLFTGCIIHVCYVASKTENSFREKWNLMILFFDIFFALLKNSARNESVYFAWLPNSKSFQVACQCYSLIKMNRKVQ